MRPPAWILQRAERLAHVDQAGWYLAVAELPWFRSDPRASLCPAGPPVLAARSGGHPMQPEILSFPEGFILFHQQRAHGSTGNPRLIQPGPAELPTIPSRTLKSCVKPLSSRSRCIWPLRFPVR
jgi:hypothetical protein